MVEIVGSIDVAQVVLYAFWVFFAILVFYLQQESRREGYPVESDDTGYYDKDTFFYMPSPKTFKLPHGQGTVTVPNDKRDTRPIAATRPNHWLGSALEPTGNPLYDAVGPGAYAERADHPDLTFDGKPKIVPLRTLPHFHLESRDIDPRGMPVRTADGERAGTIKDVWIDTSEVMIRYYEVELAGGKNVLLPSGFAALRKRKGDFYVHALMSNQMNDVPSPKQPDVITLLEEEKICAFYGGGQLYADWRRAEPII